MFIGEPGGSNRSRGLLLQEIRYPQSFTTVSEWVSLSNNGVDRSTDYRSQSSTDLHQTCHHGRVPGEIWLSFIVKIWNSHVSQTGSGIIFYVKNNFDAKYLQNFKSYDVAFISRWAFDSLCDGGVAQWQERRSWPANFPCRMLDLQLMGDHLCG